MREADDLVDELAAAIVDGTAIDWAHADSVAAATASPVIRELRLLESVASLHRELHQSGALSSDAARGSHPTASRRSNGPTFACSRRLAPAPTAWCTGPGTRGWIAKSR